MILAIASAACGESKKDRAERLKNSSYLNSLQLQHHFVGMYEKYLPALVSVAPYKSGTARPGSIGTGFFINDSGFLLTAAHVVAGRDRVLLYQGGTGVRWVAKVYNVDKKNDMALLKADFGKNPPKKQVFIPMPLSREVKTGSLFMAMGAPYGLTDSYWTGTIAHARRVAADKSRPYLTHVQLSSPVYPGSSGGPVLDLQGELIGMLRFTLTPYGRGTQGPGFALPYKLLREFSRNQKPIKEERLKALRGIVLIPITTPFLLKKVRLPDLRGALISTVRENTPAARAGLKRYDFIRTVDGKRVNSAPDFTKAMRAKIAQEQIKIKIHRDGKEIELTVSGFLKLD